MNNAIKTTYIEGDVSVGRNVALGGGVTAQGSSLFKGSVRIEGWLDANNIKGPNKGLFSSEDSLKESYPHPEDGWWAIVGDNPQGEIYSATGGEWKDTGNTGSSTSSGVSVQDIEDLRAADTAMQGDINTLLDSVSDLESKSDDNDAALQNSINGKADANHTHDDRYYTETEIDTKLAAKSDTTHNHDDKYQPKGSYLTSHQDISGKADVGHTHEIAEVNGLQGALNGKQAAGSYAASSHTHEIANINGLQDALDGKQASGSYAASSHTHSKSDITDFPTSLPASDVQSWAKAESKPTYTAAEVGALAAGGTAVNSQKVGGYSIVVGSTGSDANTIYIITD